MGKKSSALGILSALALLLLFAAVFLIAYFFPLQKSPAQQGGIEVYVEPASGAEGNLSVKIRAFSSCGQFSLYLDGREIGQGQQRLEKQVQVFAGSHVASARGGRCEKAVDFEVAAYDCTEGKNKSCVLGGCAGVQTCAGGKWGSCALPQKVCLPGEKVGCSIDSCKFGYRTCNSCGTAFGPCLAQGSDEEPLVGNSVACASG